MPMTKIIMANNMKKHNIIIAPRSLDLMMYFILGICLLIPGTMLFFASLFALINSLFKDFIIGLFISAVPLGLGTLAIIMSAKGRARIFFDRKNKNMSVLRRGSKEEKIEVDKIDSFHSLRVTYPFPGLRKFSLNVIIGGKESIKLFDESLITTATRWEAFAKKLAQKIRKPLKSDSRVEDKKLSLFNLSGK